MTPYEAAIKRTFEMTGTTAAEWRAVEVSGMTEVDNGKGGVMLPVFVFPVGYTPVVTPFSHEQDACHLCGHTIKNVFHIQHDARKLTMVVGSDCVTHFGEGLTGVAQAKADVRKTIRDLVNELHGLMVKVVEHGQTNVIHRSASGYPFTRKQWLGDAGRACCQAYSRLNFVTFHGRKTVLPQHGREASDRLLANWHAKLIPGQVEEARRLAVLALAVPRHEAANV